MRETLANVVPSFASDPRKLEQFDQKLSAESAPAAQRKLMKQALQEIIGTKPGEWFRNQQQELGGAGGNANNAKLLLKRQLKPTGAADVNGGWHTAIDAGVNPDLGLLELFH